jgi:hypothetical protein
MAVFADRGDFPLNLFAGTELRGLNLGDNPFTVSGQGTASEWA